jgi:Isochorismatase family
MNTVAGTRPYDWPFGGRVMPERTALLVAGADSGWYARCPGSPAIERTLKSAARELGRLGVPTVRLRHPPPPGAPPSRWAGPSAQYEVDAGGVDGFFASPLDGLLRSIGRDHIVLGGFGLEGPVHSTMRSANDRGYECLLLADAAAPLNVTLAHAALSMICMSGGIFGAVGETTELRSALDRATRTPTREDQ